MSLNPARRRVLTDQPMLLVALLTLVHPHELVDHRTYTSDGNLSICGTREIPLGVAAAHARGGDGPTRERLPKLEPESHAGWLDGGSADQIAAAAIKAVLEPARTSDERQAVLAYCGRTNIDADLNVAAHLVDVLTRRAGFKSPTPAPPPPPSSRLTRPCPADR